MTTYTEPILNYMREKNDAVTTSEVASAVGMNRQAAYAWFRRNEDRGLVQRLPDRGVNGADQFVLSDTPNVDRISATWQTGPVRRVLTSTTPDLMEVLRLGENFRVSGMNLDDDGRTVVTMISNDGTTFEIITGARATEDNDAVKDDA